MSTLGCHSAQTFVARRRAVSPANQTPSPTTGGSSKRKADQGSVALANRWQAPHIDCCQFLERPYSSASRAKARLTPIRAFTPVTARARRAPPRRQAGLSCYRAPLRSQADSSAARLARQREPGFRACDAGSGRRSADAPRASWALGTMSFASSSRRTNRRPRICLSSTGRITAEILRCVIRKSSGQSEQQITRPSLVRASGLR
jgi:hypothetical protein